MTVCGNRRSTFAESASRTNRLANYLSDKGFGVYAARETLERWECGQDRIALIMYNDLYPDMVIGCLKARTVPVNVNHHYSPREIRDLLDYVRPRGIIYHRSLGARFAEVLPPTGTELLISVDDGSGAPELPGAVSLDDALAAGNSDLDLVGSPDDLIMMCTGGTTGRPKGSAVATERYVRVVDGGGRPRERHRDPRQGSRRRPTLVCGFSADACGRHVDRVRGALRRPAGGALRRPQQARRTVGVGNRRARKGGHDDDGRRRLRRAVGRRTAGARL